MSGLSLVVGKRLAIEMWVGGLPPVLACTSRCSTPGTGRKGPTHISFIAAVVLATLATGCPDPCVFLGGGCNDNDDCGADQLCRKSRDFEGFGCSLVEGRCIDDDDDDDKAQGTPCGSVDDCEEGACCDPTSNTCVGELAYVAVNCDEFTCRDCNDTAFGDRCELNDDCDDDESCSADSINGFGTIEERGVCRRSCADDDGCAFFESCNSSSLCTVPIGTPCTLSEEDDGDESFVDEECLDLKCTRLDVNDERIDEPYCTELCFDPGECPSGFACDDDTNECRKLPE
jgi:hypothetical protein